MARPVEEMERNVGSMSELGARIRAARGYADLSQPELADRLGISRSTITRLERSDKNGAQGYKEEALVELIAGACGLPVEFFTADFAALANGATETGVDAVLKRLDQMDQSYREFIEDVRETVIGTAGEIQNELDAARTEHVLPSQRLDQEDESPATRGGGRRRGT